MMGMRAIDGEGTSIRADDVGRRMRRRCRGTIKVFI